MKRAAFDQHVCNAMALGTLLGAAAGCLHRYVALLVVAAAAATFAVLPSSGEVPFKGAPSDDL